VLLKNYNEEICVNDTGRSVNLNAVIGKQIQFLLPPDKMKVFCCPQFMNKTSLMKLLDIDSSFYIFKFQRVSSTIVEIGSNEKIELNPDFQYILKMRNQAFVYCEEPAKELNFQIFYMLKFPDLIEKSKNLFKINADSEISFEKTDSNNFDTESTAFKFKIVTKRDVVSKLTKETKTGSSENLNSSQSSSFLLIEIQKEFKEMKQEYKEMKQEFIELKVANEELLKEVKLLLSIFKKEDSAALTPVIKKKKSEFNCCSS